MKQFLTIIFSLISFITFSQDMKERVEKTIIQLKEQSKIDSQDKSALNIINGLYDEILQSDKGELGPKTIEKLQNFMADENSKNKYLVTLFLIYQEHLDDTASKGMAPNSEFQVLIMNSLESEFKNIYNVVPAIIYVYKYEALNSNSKIEQAKEVLNMGLNNYPSSIALKVYKYLENKDENLKKDLVQNHSNHWLVLENKIK